MYDHFTDNQMAKIARYFLSYTSIQLVNAFDDMYIRMIDGNICEMQCLLHL